MPYYITRESQECAGYAVVSVYDDQTELHGCHLTRQAAIDQMVAMSEEEGIEPGGDLDQIEESVEEDDEEMYANKVVRLSSPVRIISFSGSQVTLDAAGDTPSRTISGIAVPYNVTATVSDGTQVMFRPGALPVDGKAPKLFMYHDASQPVGLVTGRVDTDDGMLFTAKVSKTAAGDDALELAKDGVIDSVSVGVNPTEYDMDGDTMVVTAADWMELSLVPIPAFAGATITDVAASAATIPDAVSSTTNPKETAVVEAEKSVEIEAATPTAPIPAQPRRNFGMPTAGEYLAAFHVGGDTYRKVNDAFIEAAKSRQTALQAAAGDTLTTDTPGLLPVPVLGPVFDDLNYIRPVVAAVGARAMPDGGSQKTFIRPTWTTHPSVAAQSPELNPVSATTPVIASNVVTKTTLAGQVTLSVQDIDFTSPGAMEIILRDLVGQYMLASDNVAADAIASGASASGSTWTVTANDPSSLISALYDAATDILTATNFLPDHLFVSPDVWRKLGSQLDNDKRPIFPYAGAAGLMGVNGIGQANITVANTFNPFGLNLVADRNFANGTLFVARGTAIEFYEQVKGIMSVEVPSTLGRTFSYYGYVATFIADSDQVKYIVVSG
jgi:HK97 family phage prohead protease